MKKNRNELFLFLIASAINTMKYPKVVINGTNHHYLIIDSQASTGH